MERFTRERGRVVLHPGMRQRPRRNGPTSNTRICGWRLLRVQRSGNDWRVRALRRRRCVRWQTGRPMAMDGNTPPDRLSPYRERRRTGAAERLVAQTLSASLLVPNERTRRTAAYGALARSYARRCESAFVQSRSSAARFCTRGSCARPVRRCRRLSGCSRLRPAAPVRRTRELCRPPCASRQYLAGRLPAATRDRGPPASPDERRTSPPGRRCSRSWR